MDLGHGEEGAHHLLALADPLGGEGGGRDGEEGGAGLGGDAFAWGHQVEFGQTFALTYEGLAGARGAEEQERGNDEGVGAKVRESASARPLDSDGM